MNYRVPVEGHDASNLMQRYDHDRLPEWMSTAINAYRPLSSFFIIHFGPKSNKTLSPVDKIQELLPCFSSRPHTTEHAACSCGGSCLLDAPHDHA